MARRSNIEDVLAYAGQMRELVLGTVILVVLGAIVSGCGSLIVTQMTAADLRARPGFDWKRVTTEGFSIHVERGSESAERLAEIEQAAADGQRLECAGGRLAGSNQVGLDRGCLV